MSFCVPIILVSIQLTLCSLLLTSFTVLIFPGRIYPKEEKLTTLPLSLLKADFCSKLLSYNIVLKYKYVFTSYYLTQWLLLHFLQMDTWKKKKKLSSKIAMYFVCHFKTIVLTVTTKVHMTIFSNLQMLKCV